MYDSIPIGRYLAGLPAEALVGMAAIPTAEGGLRLIIHPIGVQLILAIHRDAPLRWTEAHGDTSLRTMTAILAPRLEVLASLSLSERQTYLSHRHRPADERAEGGGR